MDRRPELENRIHLSQRAGAAEAAESRGGRETFPANTSPEHYQICRVAYHFRDGKPLDAVSRIVPARAHEVGRSKTFSAATRDAAEPAIRLPRPAIFQGQQNRDARVRRAAQSSGPGNDTRFGKRETHRAVHPGAPEMLASEIVRSARALGRHQHATSRGRRASSG